MVKSRDFQRGFFPQQKTAWKVSDRLFALGQRFIPRIHACIFASSLCLFYSLHIYRRTYIINHNHTYVYSIFDIIRSIRLKWLKMEHSNGHRDSLRHPPKKSMFASLLNVAQRCSTLLYSAGSWLTGFGCIRGALEFGLLICKVFARCSPFLQICTILELFAAKWKCMVFTSYTILDLKSLRFFDSTLHGTCNTFQLQYLICAD